MDFTVRASYRVERTDTMEQNPFEIARSLSRSTQTALAIMRVAGIPAWAPSWSDLAKFVGRNGTLTEHGQAVADACVRIVREG
jgi:hypothetical protein